MYFVGANGKQACNFMYFRCYRSHIFLYLYKIGNQFHILDPHTVHPTTEVDSSFPTAVMSYMDNIYLFILKVYCYHSLLQ